MDEQTPEKVSYRFIDDAVLDKEALWAEMVARLGEMIGTARLESTFARVVPLGITDEGNFIIGVPNNFNHSVITSMHLDDLTTLASEISSHPLVCMAVLDPQLAALIDSETNTEAVDAIVHTAEQPATVDDNDFEPRYTFDSFVVGESNELAYSAARAVAENPGLKYNPLFIWGGPGLGKTHLLHAIGAYVAECFPHKKIIYTTLEALMNQYIEAVAHRSSKVNINWLRDRYRTADVLIVDDIQFLEGKNETSAFFFHTFNTLVQQHKQVIIASDRSPDLLNLEERLTSRFKMGMLADIQIPSYEVKLKILQQYTRYLGIAFSPESLSYLAEKSSGNIREMEGTSNRVAAYAELRHLDSVSLELTQDITKTIFTEQPKRPISIDIILNETCHFYHLTRSDIVGTKRKQEIAHARHIAMFLCSELTDSSYPAIGRAFGGKDHTTVMHAVKKITKKMGEDRDIFNQIKILTDYVNKKVT